MFSGVKVFLSQFLTRKSVLCRLWVSSAVHSSWKLTTGLILLGMRPTDAIRNLPRQFEASPKYVRVYPHAFSSCGTYSNRKATIGSSCAARCAG
jgi:hypothetical protein